MGVASSALVLGHIMPLIFMVSSGSEVFCCLYTEEETEANEASRVTQRWAAKLDWTYISLTPRSMGPASLGLDDCSGAGDRLWGKEPSCWEVLPSWAPGTTNVSLYK